MKARTQREMQQFSTALDITNPPQQNIAEAFAYYCNPQRPKLLAASEENISDTAAVFGEDINTPCAFYFGDIVFEFATLEQISEAVKRINGAGKFEDVSCVSDNGRNYLIVPYAALKPFIETLGFPTQLYAKLRDIATVQRQLCYPDSERKVTIVDRNPRHTEVTQATWNIAKNIVIPAPYYPVRILQEALKDAFEISKKTDVYQSAKALLDQKLTSRVPLELQLEKNKGCFDPLADNWLTEIQAKAVLSAVFGGGAIFDEIFEQKRILTLCPALFLKDCLEKLAGKQITEGDKQVAALANHIKRTTFDERGDIILESIAKINTVEFTGPIYTALKTLSKNDPLLARNVERLHMCMLYGPLQGLEMSLGTSDQKRATGKRAIDRLGTPPTETASLLLKAATSPTETTSRPFVPSPPQPQQGESFGEFSRRSISALSPPSGQTFENTPSPSPSSSFAERWRARNAARDMAASRGRGAGD